MIHLKAATVLEKNDISWARSRKDKPTEGYGWSGPHVVNKQEGRGGSGMNDSYLEGPGESHKSHTRSQLSACEVGFLFLVLLLPSSILVFMWPFPWEGHAPCKRSVLAVLPPGISSHENKCTGTQVENSVSCGLLGKLMSWVSDQSWEPEPTLWCFYQAAVIPSGPASSSCLASIHQNRNHLLTSLI